MLVVEVGAGIYQRTLTVHLLYHVEELEERVAKSLGTQSPRHLYVNHRNQVLLTRFALGKEISHLQLLIHRGTVEVV